MQDREVARLFAQEELIAEATELVARTMRQNGLSQSSLARRVGVSKGYISQLLGGSRNMTLRTFADLMFAMGHKALLTSTSVSDAVHSDAKSWVVHIPRDRSRHKWEELVLSTGAAVPAA
jgi:transcriptional regulator with XRE-family HTH domain